MFDDVRLNALLWRCPVRHEQQRDHQRDVRNGRVSAAGAVLRGTG